MADTKAKLAKQIAYYFSDPNIMTDKFLLERVRSNEKGWVELAVFLTFNKVKSLTTDVAVLQDAVAGLEGLELDEEKKNVRRTAPLPEKWDPRMCFVYLLFVFLNF